LDASAPISGDGGREPIPPSSSPAGTEPSQPGGRSLLQWLRFSAIAPALIPAGIIVAVIVIIAYASGFTSLHDFYSFNWSPGRNHWGIGVFVVGSLLAAVPALTLSMLIGLGLAIASTSYLPRLISGVLDPFVDLLAGIPSVIYGIWGFVVIGPYFGITVNPWLADHLRLIPWFGPPSGNTLGLGLPLAIFLLTLMALPITTLLIRDSLRAVPRDLWESGLALGATRWEVLRKVALPYSRRGIMSAGFLGFGRAFGETVAVAMVIGSTPIIPTNFYSSGYTMAAAMFELLDSAYGNSQFLAALCEMALVLLAISLVVNVVGRRLVIALSTTEVAGV
jgi:phosphate transport system permease protein